MEFEEIKNNTIPPHIPMNPISYYNYNIQKRPEKKQKNQNQQNQAKQKSTNSVENHFEEIEQKIKNKFNMIMPAIIVEFKDLNYTIEYDKDDLRKVKKNKIKFN